MRSLVLRGRIKNLSQTASLLVISGLVAGCSSGFSRFENSLMASSAPQGASAAVNPYPDGLDRTTTASVRRRFSPMGDVGSKAPTAEPITPRGVYYHSPEPQYAAPQYPQKTAQQQPVYIAPKAPQYKPPAPQPYPVANYSPPIPQYQATPKVEKRNLPKLSNSGYTKRSLDMVNTSSVDREIETGKSTIRTIQAFPGDMNSSQPYPENAKVTIPKPLQPKIASAGNRANGWSRIGGTVISVRNGETLYNISKRYGVPVSALMKVNGFSNADQVQAGQQIVIPNFIYSKTASVSAPDNDPKTRASTSHTGMIGEIRNIQAPIPSRRPSSQVARYVEPIHDEPQEDFDKPDYSLVTGSIRPNPIKSSSIYVVKSGDSLSRIASKNGVSVSALKSHNKLNDYSIKIGQKLRIPSARSVTNVAALNDGFGVDPIITGSIKPTVSPAKRKAKKISEVSQAFPGDVAPKRTGISEFRWPVRGRVISKFGEKNGSARNKGIDISVPEGTAVRAVENGVVLYVGNEVEEYGRLILVRHEDGWVSAYAHNKTFEVTKGETIRRGQIIARSGRTGTTSQPKLHFELRKNAKPVNPLKHLGRA